MNELKKKINLALRRVIDPELSVSIVDLGLVYAIKIRKNQKENKFNVVVVMTLTSMGCPLAGMIEAMIKNEVGKVVDVGRVRLEIVWEPVWTPDKINPKIKVELGLD